MMRKITTAPFENSGAIWHPGNNFATLEEQNVYRRYLISGRGVSNPFVRMG